SFVFQPKAIERVIGQVQRLDGRKPTVDQGRTEQQRRRGERERDEHRGYRSYSTGSNRSPPLGRVRLIVDDVERVVEEIHRARKQAKARLGERRTRQLSSDVRLGENERDEYEDVLRPVARPGNGDNVGKPRPPTRPRSSVGASVD